MSGNPLIVIIGGYLGAGKTTLVSQLLAKKDARRVAVVVNELASLGIDGELLREANEGLTELRDGCICCSNLSAFEQTIEALIAEPFDVILVELSGQATFLGPLQVISRLSRQQALRLPLRVVVVDAVNHRAHAVDPILHDQLAYADLVVLNKAAEVSDEDRNALLLSFSTRIPLANVLCTNRAMLRWEDLGPPKGERALRLIAIGATPHDTSISTVAIDVAGTIDPERFDVWLQGLIAVFGDDVLRAKGWLNVGCRDRRTVFQAVHRHVETTEGSPWGQDEQRVNRLVLIGRGLREADVRSAFAALVSLRCE